MKKSESKGINSIAIMKNTEDEILLKKKPYIDWLSGLIGGFVSVSCCAPLDLARTRHMVIANTKSHGVIVYKGFLDTLKQIYKNEGFFGLYKGYSVTAYSIPFFHSLYFTIYFQSKNYIHNKWNSENYSLLKNMGAALFTGLICDTITNPLWVIRTRVQSQFLHQEHEVKYKGIFSSGIKIAREEGVRALMKGLVASYVGLSHAIILYPTYEELKIMIQKSKGSLSHVDIFAASMISKFLAMVLTYPHVVIRARLQDNRTELKDRNVKLTFLGQFKSTLEREGVIGLYSGLRIDLIRCLPANAITFMTFEYVKNHLEKMVLKEHSY